jgi:hypothetical protein
MATKGKIYSDHPNTIVTERIELVRTMVRQDLVTGREESDVLQRDVIARCQVDRVIGEGTLSDDLRPWDFSAGDSLYYRFLAACRGLRR